MTVKLDQLFDDALSVAVARFDSRIVDYSLEIDRGLRAQTEPQAWCELIASLVENSVRHRFEHLPDGGSITLSASRIDRERVRVVYRDSGCATPRTLATDFVRERLHGTIVRLDDGLALAIDIPTRPPHKAPALAG